MSLPRMREVGTAFEMSLLNAARANGASAESAQNAQAKKRAVIAASAVALAAGTLGTSAATSPAASLATSLATPANAPMGTAALLSPTSIKLAMWLALSGGVVGVASILLVLAWPKHEESAARLSADRVSQTAQPPSSAVLEKTGLENTGTVRASPAVSHGIAAGIPSGNAATMLPSITLTSVATPPRAAAPSAQRAAAAPADDGDEISMVVRAKREIAQKHPADASATLDRHDALFPHGALSEEVEALRVEALSEESDAAGAHAAAARYLSRHPNGAYARRVQAVVDAMPLDPMQ
jgi:hypothetical protein